MRRHLHVASASRRDLVEAWFAPRHLRQGVSATTADPEAAIHASHRSDRGEPKPFVRTASADAILAGVERFCRRTATQITGAVPDRDAIRNGSEPVV